MDEVREYLKTTPFSEYSVEVASADASFRKYYRLRHGEKSLIFMDSSLEKESLKPFVNITKKLLDAVVYAPKILLKDMDRGFLIIEDFGTTHYLDLLNEKTYKSLYKKAIDTIIQMQKADVDALPIYDKEFLHFEMDLMDEWYISKLLNKTLTTQQKKLLYDTLQNISKVVLKQEQNLFVHRDFHSRNILLTKDKRVGVIDYQDAMNGAVTYDLVSLLKDCYIEFGREDIEELALYFRDKKGLKVSDDEFLKWFDFMGMQRHIKVLGVFARLYLRDAKDGYLKDIPLTLKYFLDAGARYEETKELAKLLKELQ
ncbi:MAG: phosphotransferase [Epsilonproteobacteria bacterium]|nr:phosphotransferase [Campylobacterota bacterium]